MLTPNLNSGSTILWSMHWFNGSYLDWLVIPVLGRIFHIFKCTIERDCESNVGSISFSISWTILALDAKSSTANVSAFLFINSWLSRWAVDVGTADNLIAELAFWFWMLLLEWSKWTTSNNNFGVTSCWTGRWRDAINNNSWFSAFKELVLFGIRWSTFFGILFCLLSRVSE
jgi:hypothetical protein